MTTLAEEVAQATGNQRMLDLLRVCRAELHGEELITDEEYAWLAGLPSKATHARLKDYDELRGDLATAARVLTEAQAALQKISDIRDSIVGAQSFNWSEHAYPLVAILDAAGFEGAGYEIAAKNLGTLIESRRKAEAELEEVRNQAAAAFDATAAAYEELKAKMPGADHVVVLKADYERLIKSLPTVRAVK